MWRTQQEIVHGIPIWLLLRLSHSYSGSLGDSLEFLPGGRRENLQRTSAATDSCVLTGKYQLGAWEWENRVQTIPMNRHHMQ